MKLPNLRGLEFYQSEKLVYQLEIMGDRWVVTDIIPIDQFLLGGEILTT